MFTFFLKLGIFIYKKQQKELEKTSSHFGTLSVLLRNLKNHSYLQDHDTLLYWLEATKIECTKNLK